MMPLPQPLQAVLFDLDGTLLDSAPDLYEALRRLCIEEGVAVPDFAPVRQVVSRGSRGVLQTAFAGCDEAAMAALITRFLALYEAVMTQARPFAGIDAVLAALEARGVRWGIVTNKATFLAQPIVAALGWDRRAAAVICGDTLAVKKPDPAPVLLACERVGATPAQCVFVGDDRRDVQAGRAAGLHTVAVRWGYLDGGDPDQWQADQVLGAAPELLGLLPQRGITA